MVSKERTSITISPELFAEAKAYCQEVSKGMTRKISFSELVNNALEFYMDIHKETKEVTVVEDEELDFSTNGVASLENVQHV